MPRGPKRYSNAEINAYQPPRAPKGPLTRWQNKQFLKSLPHVRSTLSLEQKIISQKL